ncbi:MAG: 3-dehydroquinate synthase [Gemmatimonadota bacterium]|nr:3-dehydroquinate synthase [Gemmatimonadota bacterium]
MATVQRVYRNLVRGRFCRDDLVINLSGGMLGDLSGFAAATYMRGMRWVQVPTTVLSQVDASVGGKVGVNLPAGKNLVGSFYQPWMVMADTDTLMTLPGRTFRAGLAEVVKMAVAFDGEFFRFLCVNARAILARRPRVLAEMVKQSVTLKAKVVAMDEREGGYRMTLNYGHTLAHALEKTAGYRSLNHGEAVSLGMCAAAQLARELGKIKEDVVGRQRDLLEAFGLPVSLSPAQRERLRFEPVMEALVVDKKQRHGGLRLVLPSKIGSVDILNGVPDKIVRRVFRRFLERG